LRFLTSGNESVAIGLNAGSYQFNGATLTTSNNSVYLGPFTRGYSNSDNNTIVIGYGAVGQGANTVVIGNDSIISTCLKGDVSITSPLELGAETLTNPNLIGGTSWAATNDCILANDKATWLYSAGGASTLTQTAANLAVPGVGGKWYRFDYTVSGVEGTMVLSPTITTSFSETAFNLNITNGSHTVYFKSAASPTDFVISSSVLLTSPTFSLDNLSLKQVTSEGNLRVPSTKAALDIYSTTKGFLSPRMTTTQRDAITSVPEGLTIYNLTNHRIEYYNGTSWISPSSMSAFVTKTSNYTASLDDCIIEGDTTSVGAFTITLPTAVGISGKTYIIKRMGAATLSVGTASSQTIDAVAAPLDILTDKVSVTLVSDGENWLLI
jgi:hypothetical protein